LEQDHDAPPEQAAPSVGSAHDAPVGARQLCYRCTRGDFRRASVGHACNVHDGRLALSRRTAEPPTGICQRSDPDAGPYVVGGVSMQEVPRTGGTSNDGPAAAHARLVATFKLATPYVVVVRQRAMPGRAKVAANVNRVGLVLKEPDQPRSSRP
jgi:hypothetical protein